MAFQINYNNLISILSGFTSNHLQLQRFGFGTLPELEREIANSGKFPMLWVNLVNVTYPTDNQKSFNFNILVFDVLDSDESNERDIHNDSILALEDLIKFLWYSSSNLFRLNFGSQLNIQPFTEKFTEVVAGATLSIQIEVDFDGQNSCSIPMEQMDIILNQITYNND